MRMWWCWSSTGLLLQQQVVSTTCAGFIAGKPASTSTQSTKIASELLTL